MDCPVFTILCDMIFKFLMTLIRVIMMIVNRMKLGLCNVLYTDDHRGQLIAYVISNSDHITLNTNTPTRVSSTTLQQTSSPYITAVSNTLYNRTSWTTQHTLSSDHLPIISTINIRHDYRQQHNRRTFTNYKKVTEHNSRKTQRPLSLRLPSTPAHTLPT